MNREQLKSFQELMSIKTTGGTWSVLDAVRFVDQLAELDLLWHFDDDVRDCLTHEQASDRQCDILHLKALASREVLGEETLFHLAIDYNELFQRRRDRWV